MLCCCAGKVHESLRLLSLVIVYVSRCRYVVLLSTIRGLEVLVMRKTASVLYFYTAHSFFVMQCL